MKIPVKFFPDSTKFDIKTLDIAPASDIYYSVRSDGLVIRLVRSIRKVSCKMNRTLFSALCLGLCTAPAWAGFTLTTTVTDIPANPRTKIQIQVWNRGTAGDFGNNINTFDGLDGVALRAVIHSANNSATRKFSFNVGDFEGGEFGGDGEPETLDLSFVGNTNLYGFVRAANSGNTYTGIEPITVIAPNNPWQQGSGYFEVAVVQVGNNTAANTSPGYTAIMLLVDDGAVVNLSGALGGNAGPDIPFTLSNIRATGVVAPSNFNGAPYIYLDTYYVDAFSDGSLSFTADVEDPENQVVTTTATGLPSFVDLVTSPGAPSEFTLENNRPLTPLDQGNYPVVIRTTDPNGSYAEKEIMLRILQPIPEPATMMVLGGIGLVTLRRRRI